MGKKFTEYSRFDLSEINKEVLNQWDKQDLFHQSLETREGCPSFVFYEGPPSANGMPGIHHVMARSIKDIFCRYKTMKGLSRMIIVISKLCGGCSNSCIIKIIFIKDIPFNLILRQQVRD